MIINIFLLTGNPFIDAYVQSDLIGKLIFLSLISLSIITWALFFYKWRTFKQMQKSTAHFQHIFSKYRMNPLQVETSHQNNPFIALYKELKRSCIEMLHKNRQSEKFSPDEAGSLLSPTDLNSIEIKLDGARKKERAALEKNIYILSTIVTLGPFLGLLGTVWGILTTFSHMQQSMGVSNQMVLSGLSLALATTVLGLIDAIPALLGYNYLKQLSKEFDQEMESFSLDILSAVELQYRQVDL